MRQADYPPQEPLSEAGEAYAAQCWARSAAALADPSAVEAAYGADPYQRLLVFPAARPTGPVLVFWHGGGWTSGYKEWMAFMAPAFTAAGITFVTAGYRLAPGHVFPAGLDDCLAALGWVGRHVGGHGGDPRRLFIGGHSAGGHYAALIAADRSAVERVGLEAGQVRGCLPLSGVFRFGEGSGLSVRPRFLGADDRHERPASPVEQLRGALPPFLVAWGTRDFPHLIVQAGEFVGRLRALGAEVEALEMADRTHFTASFAGGEADGPWVPAALAFIGRHA